MARAPGSGFLLRGAIVLLLGGVAACAPPLPDVTPAQVPALEADLVERPDDPDLQTRLGIAYYKADRPEDAVATLVSAREDGGTAAALYLFLGLAHEELEEWSGARRAYGAYLESGRQGALRERIESRMSVIVRRELRAQAEDALTREARLSDTPPEPRTVAVFPFRLLSERRELESLGVAVADMMITDLGLAGGVQVLERSRIQALLDEMALTEAGLTEGESGARAGRLLRAQHVVQGAVTPVGEETIRMSADVRNTVSRETEGRTTGEDELSRLFDLEKRAVFDVLDVLGVDLTPAERQAINENRAENILAFLAYGRGLQALDRGDYATARQRFQEAVEIDPGFGQARGQLDEASRLETGDQVTPAQIAQQASADAGGSGPRGSEVPPGGAMGGLLDRTVQHTTPSPADHLTNQGNPESGVDRQAGERNPTQEATDSDRVGRRSVGTITITIRRPSPGGGGQR